MHPLLFALSGALASTLFGLSAPAPAPRAMRALVCRGAANIDLRIDKDPSPYNDRYVRFVLRYQPGHQPVGSAFENLPPGSCSWNPNNFPGMPTEPGLIYIDIAKAAQDYAGGRADTTVKAAEHFADATTLPRYLKVPDHYWLFYVDDVTNLSNSFMAAKYTPRQLVVADRPVVVDSGGPAGKSTDRAGTSTRGTGSLRDASPTLDAAKVPLTFRDVVRTPTQYRIKFGARANANATVEYSLKPPTRIGGLLKFQSPKRLPVAATETRGFVSEYSTTPARGLPMGGTKVYFMIRVPAAGRDKPAQEYSGEFATLIQTVVVRFTRIHILNDSDKASAGDLGFRFFLAPATALHAECLLPDNCWENAGPFTWETGSDNPVSVELRMDRAASQFRVWVAGFENDRVGDDGMRTTSVSYAAAGRSSSTGDQNNARGQFDLTRLANNARLGFKLRSVDGFVLMYEVHGEIEVIRR